MERKIGPEGQSDSERNGGAIGIGPNGRYQLGRNLNEGHFGKVKLAYDKEKKEYVAVKFIPRGPQVTEYVEREILNHRTLCHPHIISFKEVFLIDEYLCIVMEYAAGGDMHQYIARQKCLSEKFGRWFFQQLVIAIDYCHKRDVVNRDIKLENILLDQGQKLLKVCDFGFSKGGKDSLPKTCVGTPSYLAPEVLKNPLVRRRYDGKKVDIWTCGVCLFVMLYGYYPFDDPYDTSQEKTKRMLARIAGGQVDIPPYQFRHTEGGVNSQVPVSEECRELLARILESNPQKRMEMDDIIQHPWFLKGLPDGALDYNRGIEKIDEELIEKTKGLQKVEQIKLIISEARTSLGGS